MRESGETASPESEEGVKIKGKTIVVGPSKEEYDEHMRTHVPFRSWCEFCVKGKAKADPHKRGIQERGIPTIGIDYTFPKSESSKEDSKTEKAKDEGERGMPVIVMKIDLDKWTASFVVPQKGVCEYAVKEVARQIQNAGYHRVIFERSRTSIEGALKGSEKRKSGTDRLRWSHGGGIASRRIGQ